MKFSSYVALGLLLALLLSASGAFAHGGEGGGGNRPGPVANRPSVHLIETWHLLLAARDAIAMGIEAGQSDRIHEKAETVPKLAQTLMRESSDLSQAKRARVKSGVTQLSKVSEHLFTVAESGDPKLLLGDLKRIDRALRLIRAQYPEDSLPLSTQSSGGHAAGHH